MNKIKRALISVSDKKGIVELGKRLQQFKIEIVSTGGTAKMLLEAGVPVMEISEFTGFPEIMDGRVKTLHPKVHGGLLNIRDDARHQAQKRELEIEDIDLVVVNLYPFQKTIDRPDVTLPEAIEQIDIGGPSMVRSAAKNHRYVTVVTDPADYPRLLDLMQQNGGAVPDDFKFEMALKVFRMTSAYDATIAAFLEKQINPGLPQRLQIVLDKAQEMRYGENPHQIAAFYREARLTEEPCVSNAVQLNGKELSFNNILDIDAALEIVKEFTGPAAVVIKHTNPCGAAIAGTLVEAFQKAYAGDPVSAFGSILGFSRPVDRATAEEIATPDRFVEAIIAPGYEPGVVEILVNKPKWGKNVRIMQVDPLDPGHIDANACDFKRVVGGMLVQGRNLKLYGPDGLKCATKRKPTDAEKADLEFAWILCKHVKSNAIVIAKDGAVAGVGAGQMSRVDSSMIAARKAGAKAKGASLASDAFFPFPDGVEAAAEAGVKAIIQPGGAKNDDDVIAAANKAGIAMLLTGMRHFRH